MSIERIVLSHLLLDDTYARRVLPYLQDVYFQDPGDQLVYKLIDHYVKVYNKLPSARELKVELDDLDGTPERAYELADEAITSLSTSRIENEDWLLDATEKFCKDKGLKHAIHQAIQIQDDKTGKLDTGSIPQILSDALAISFDSHIGHDYFEDAEKRWEFYHQVEKKIPFHLEYLNRITRGGIVSKTLTVIMAGTGVGKSLMMCDFAAAHLMQGYNVLYITLEMAEERIAERIDANLCNIPLDELENLDKDLFMNKVKSAWGKTPGKLLIKEYPNGSANASHFRHLLNELKLKKTFIPDIVYVDYLNICASSRLKMSQVNSYQYIKAISEELRSLSQEFNLPIISATQTNRGGIGSSDIELTDTSESIGLPMTVDLMFAIMEPEEFIEKSQFLVKQLKNRYSDKNRLLRFVIGVDKPKMRLYDVEEQAQENILGGPMAPPQFQKPSANFEEWE